MAQPAPALALRVVCYDGTPPPPSWDLDETPVAEAHPHDQASELMRQVLEAASPPDLPHWVARNLALRFYEARPSVGVDPDVALYAPPPPDTTLLSSVRTWEAGHQAPKVALEVVSESNAAKDYGDEGLSRYAASGVGELWVFDPLLAGPREGGGPYRLQVWVRNRRGQLVREYAGPGPARSPYLKAWLVVVEGGLRLRVSDDRAGRRLWPTAKERAQAAEAAERAAKERAQAAEAAERAAKERALAAEAAERAAKEAERTAKEQARAAEAAERAAKEQAQAAEAAERAAKEQAQAAEAAERAAKEAALDELARLRAEFEALRGDKR
jgi:Uma2 family endonuclease